MNTDTLCIRSFTESENLTAQQNIDADIILPDYYDTIGKILKYEIIPVIEAVTTTADKISVAGIAKFTMIYIGEDNKMYCYENEYRYTKVFRSQFAEGCLSTKTTQTVFSINCRAMAPKRIELRAVLQVGIKINTSADKYLISKVEDNSIIAKCENISYITPVNSVFRSFSLSGSYPLTESSDKIDVIIRKNSSVRISEIKTIHNKAYIKGTAETEIMYYTNETGNTSTTVLSLPLSEIIDIFGAEDDDLCEVYINDIFTEVTIKNGDNNVQTLEIRLDVCVQAEINRSVTHNILTDVYSIKNEIYTVKDTADLITSRKKISKNESIVFETDIYDDSKLSVLSSWINNMRISSEQHVNKYNLLVTVTFNALTKNEYGILSVISREHTFETDMFSESQENIIINIKGNVSSISALQTATGKIRFSADILFEGDMCTTCKVSAFTSLEINEAISYDGAPKYIVYFARENEEIWAIAKENRTSAELIKETNSLTGDIITEDKMLLLPSF